MENIIIVAVSVLILVFGFVVAFGAPYLPTLSKEVEDALDLLDLEPGQTMLELGSGDGKVLLAAAQRGIKGVGYEINPLLVLWTKIRCWRYRKLVTVHLQGFWTADWPDYDGVYVFLLQKYMGRLDTKITQSLESAPKGKQVRVVSFAWTMPGRKPAETVRGLRLYIFTHSPSVTK